MESGIRHAKPVQTIDRVIFVKVVQWGIETVPSTDASLAPSLDIINRISERRKDTNSAPFQNIDITSVSFLALLMGERRVAFHLASIHPWGEPQDLL